MIHADAASNLIAGQLFENRVNRQFSVPSSSPVVEPPQSNFVGYNDVSVDTIGCQRLDNRNNIVAPSQQRLGSIRKQRLTHQQRRPRCPSDSCCCCANTRRDSVSCSSRLSFIRCDLAWPGGHGSRGGLFVPVVDCALQPTVVVKDHLLNRVVVLSGVAAGDSDSRSRTGRWVECGGWKLFGDAAISDCSIRSVVISICCDLLLLLFL